MKIFFDGGAAPNPGAMTAALVVDGVAMEDKNLGYGTNNVAEWVALLWAMETALNADATDVEIIGDSMLVINQANGLWKIKHANFLPFKAEFDRMRAKFASCVVRHVGRNHNLAGQYIEDGQKGRRR